MRLPSVVRHETWPIAKDTSSTCEHVSLSERVRARLTSYRKLRASSADRCSQPVLRPNALDRPALERQSFCTIRERGRVGSDKRSLTPIPVPSVSPPQPAVTSSCSETKMEDCEVQMRPHKQQLLRSPCKRSAATRRSMSYDVPQVSTAQDVDQQSELPGLETKPKWQSLESILDAGESVSRRSSLEGPSQNKLYRRGMYCDSDDMMVSPVKSPLYTQVIPCSLRRRSRSLSALDEPDYAEIEEEDDEEDTSEVLVLNRSYHDDETFVNPLHCLNGVLPGYYNAVHYSSSGAYAVPQGSEMGSGSSSASSTASNTPIIRCDRPARDVNPYSVVNICPNAASSPDMPPPPVPSKQRPSLAAQNNNYMTPSSASVSSESTSESSRKQGEALTLTVRDETSGAPICLVDVSFAADSCNNNTLSRPLDLQKILESSSEQAVRTPLGTISLRARAPRPEVMSQLVVPREPECAECHQRPASVACKQDVSTGTCGDDAPPEKRRSRSPLAGLHSLFSFRKNKS